MAAAPCPHDRVTLGRHIGRLRFTAQCLACGVDLLRVPVTSHHDPEIDHYAPEEPGGTTYQRIPHPLRPADA
jgi:hypothetical protein